MSVVTLFLVTGLGFCSRIKTSWFLGSTSEEMILFRQADSEPALFFLLLIESKLQWIRGVKWNETKGRLERLESVTCCSHCISPWADNTLQKTLKHREVILHFDDSAVHIFHSLAAVHAIDCGVDAEKPMLLQKKCNFLGKNLCSCSTCGLIYCCFF